MFIRVSSTYKVMLQLWYVQVCIPVKKVQKKTSPDVQTLVGVSRTGYFRLLMYTLIIHNFMIKN